MPEIRVLRGTPLFQHDGSPAAAAEPDAEAAAGREHAAAGNDTDPTSSDSGAGSPIMEALRLASALADWSEQTGLTDTLKALASEAAESLSTQASTTAAPGSSRVSCGHGGGPLTILTAATRAEPNSRTPLGGAIV
jgi:hypothetical protein